MPTPHYKLTTITRGSRRNGRFRPAKGGRSAARKLAYIERGGEHKSQAEDVLAVGRSGPDLGTWVCADRAEIRKDALVCRQVICSIPHTLSHDQQIKIAQSHADRIRRETGCAVRWALHRAGEGDERNMHLHFLISARPVSDQGIFNENKETRFDRKLGGPQFTADLRSDWQDRVNDEFLRVGSTERLDLRTRKAQGLQGEALQRISMIEFQMARRGEIHSAKYEANRLILAVRSATDACAVAQSNLAQFRRAVARSGDRIKRALGIQQIARRRIAVTSGASRLAASLVSRTRYGRDRGYGLARPAVSATNDICVGGLQEASAVTERPQTSRGFSVDTGSSETLRGNEDFRNGGCDPTDSEHTRSVIMARPTTTAGPDSAGTDSGSNDGPLIRSAGRRPRKGGDRARAAVDGVLPTVPPNGRASGDSGPARDDGRRAATGLFGGKSNSGEAQGPRDGARSNDSGGTRNDRKADANSGGTLIDRVWRWLSRSDRTEAHAAARTAAEDAATVLKRAREDEHDRHAAHADQARARIEERTSRFAADETTPLLQITTSKGSIYYILARDWRDAKIKVDVPLCDQFGTRLEEGAGKRTRLRRSTIETCKVAPVSAAVARTPNPEPISHDENTVVTLFAADEKSEDSEQTRATDSL